MRATPIIIAVLFTLSNEARAELRGDAEAIALAEKMINRLGGSEIWSETRTLYMHYEGWRADSSQPVVEEAWRDLTEPRQKMVFKSRRAEAALIITPEASWIEHSETGVRRQDDATHRANLDFWNFDFYTIIHNLARGDDRIRLKFQAPQTIEISGPGGADWGWFEIDQTGQPVRWGAPDGDDRLEYIYGPVKPFGVVNFPAWGTAVDGFWRFEYKEINVDWRPLPITLNPPADE